MQRTNNNDTMILMISKSFALKKENQYTCFTQYLQQMNVTYILLYEIKYRIE